MGEMASLGDLMPGSLALRHHRCGRKSCHCQQPGDPGHGPYYILTCQQDGRQTTRSVPAAKLTTVQRQVKTFQRLRALHRLYLAVSAQLCAARHAERAPAAV